jgi:dihydrolipoamide dehydrogenase
MKDVEFILGCKVEKISDKDRWCQAHIAYGDGARHQSALKDDFRGSKSPLKEGFRPSKSALFESIEASIILMAAGRVPVLDTWGAKAVGVDVDKRGVRVDDRMRTNVPLVWAAGDVTGKSLLAHSAYRMGEVAAADIIATLDGNNAASSNRMRYNAIPWAVYGLTEAAGVGLTEQEAARNGIAVLKASLPMKASGRFVAENTFAAPGAVKVIASAADRRILGIHAVGAYSPEFIWGGAALIEQEFRIEDVKQLIFPHPTVSELIKDVVWELENA